MPDEKEIWKYQTEDDEYKVTVLEKDSGVIVIRSVGIASGRGMIELFDFIDGYAKKAGKQFKVLADNTELAKADRDARKAVIRFLDPDGPIEKIATYGDNIAIRAFMNLYAALTRIPVRIFSAKSEAEAWLLRGGPGDEE